MMRLYLLLVLLLTSVLIHTARGDDHLLNHPATSKLLVHYMPWFDCDPSKNSWGWHWTMNAFDPSKIQDGRREIASHFSPVIGPYDSGNAAVIEYHLLLMKTAGIDGVIIDWYGLEDFRDYTILHRNTQRLIEQADAIGLRFAICYEDQTVPALVSEKRISDSQRVDHVVSELKWLVQHWFRLKGYVRVDGKPLLLSFGQDGLTDSEWARTLQAVEPPIAYLSQNHRRTSAIGAFDWPLPKFGVAATQRFIDESAQWPVAMPVAFPRFVDIYAEAKVHPSWGRIDDDAGRVFSTTLKEALATKQPWIQIATWNDWGEGTMIEPSHEFGHRDLELIQTHMRSRNHSPLSARPEDLRLPHQLYQLRQAADAESHSRLDQIAKLIATGSFSAARSQLELFRSRP